MRVYLYYEISTNYWAIHSNRVWRTKGTKSIYHLDNKSSEVVNFVRNLVGNTEPSAWENRTTKIFEIEL